jgi:peroxiredoxin
MKHSCLLIVLVIVLVPQLVFCSDASVKDFTMPSARNDSLIRLADYSGRVILINWWRTSCAWSQRESPKLVDLNNRYRGRGFVIVGISDDTADSVGQVPAYLKRYGITWPVGLNDQGEFMREIRPLGRGETPGNYLVSRSGKITYLGLDRGPEDWQKLEKAVAAAVAEAAVKTSPIQPRELVPAPAFSLPDLQGKTVRLADFKGKPLVVNFFTAETCDWTGAVLANVEREYAARGLQMVGINLFNDDATIRNCSSKHGIHYPVLRGDQNTQVAWIGGAKGWATFFVTSDGKVLKRIVDSINNGIETQVFTKYAAYLVTKH